MPFLKLLSGFHLIHTLLSIITLTILTNPNPLLRKTDDNRHIDGVRQRLWTAATSRPIVYRPSDI
jgi:hypothetical protein